MKRVVAIIALVVGLASSCANAPDPGDLAAFCSLLESGTGLTSSPTARDLERLVLVAPPGVRPTIEALQNRIRDFDELVALDPPDIEALFNAKFDPQATSERAELDTFAESSCGIAVDRPPATRWNNYVRDQFDGEAWVGLAVPGFETGANQGDRIRSATLVFAEPPEPRSLIEDACESVAEFLIADGAEPGRIQVFVGSVAVLEQDSPNGPCRLP